jgi:CDP-diacylglycerol--glycerol-3-phosphate 3-phosphatidyltransferase
MKNVPNALTITRIALTPVMLVFLMSNTLLGLTAALSLFVVGAISDYLDGKIARSYEVRSRLGQFLDPFADKVLVLGTFVAVAFLVPQVVPWWAVAVIALRDVAVTGLRSWAESRGRSIRTKNIARAKTLSQLLFLIYLLFVMVLAKVPGGVSRGAQEVLYGPISYTIMLLVVAFTVFTGIVYLLKIEYSSQK